jgi:GTP:adenosylcobinamide-phosphate guanylyltransferase
MNAKTPEPEKFTAVVLAGDRHANDPVAVDAGVCAKAITPICGTPMILRVLDALEESGVISSIILCGPTQQALEDCPELEEGIKHKNIEWLPGLDSPSRSAELALLKIEEDRKILLTTADHALLKPEIVSYFVAQCLSDSVDASVGIIDYQTIADKYPEVQRTVIKLSDGGFCGCNLFAFMTQKGRRLVPYWRQVEQRRKRPVKMIAGILGISGVLLYLLGKLSLDAALRKVSKGLGLTIKPVQLPFPEAGVDVDTVKDREFVERILQEEIN